MYFKVVTIKFMPKHKLKSHRLSPRPLFSVRWIGKSSFSKRITLFHHHFFLILYSYFSSNRQTAEAAMPKPAPVNPSPSSVVALTLICFKSIRRVSAIFFRICSICGAILGFCAIIVASIFIIQYPCQNQPQNVG